MRIVITGATGNVGTSLVELLADDDRITEITGIARRAPDRTAPKTRWAEADVATDELGDLFEGADAVVHLAWIFQPTHDPVATWRNNAVGARRVFDAVASAGVDSLVYASSVGAYSPGPDGRAVDESWPTDSWPTAAYGREKAYVERVLDAFEARHPAIRVVRMRPGFIFKRAAASAQRRLFAGPFLPNRLVRPARVPVVPDLPGLRFQALHTRDAAAAYREALVRDVRGPFNVAADDVVDATVLGELLRARVVPLPPRVAHGALSALWRLRLVPASPHLLDLALHLPLMDLSRARDELGWAASCPARDAMAESISGMSDAAGGDTPPLRADAGGPARLEEVRTGVGGSGGVTADGR